MKHLLYKTTNLINNKIYIGVHSTNNLDDGYLGSGKVLQYAIKKYGKNNFKREIIQEFETREAALAEEAKIVDGEFIRRSDTYNTNTGGGHNWHGMVTVRDKDGNKFQVAKDDPRYLNGELIFILCGTNLSIQQKKHLSLLNSGKNNSFYGKNHSTKTKDKISHSVMKTRKYGKDHHRSYTIRIINFNNLTDEYTECLTDYVKKYNLPWSALQKSLSNTRIVTRGKAYGYLVLNASDTRTINELLEIYSKIKVFKDNECIGYFQNTKRAAEALNISHNDFWYKAKYPNKYKDYTYITQK